MLSASCSRCGGRFQVNDELAGKTLKCRKCQGSVRVPEAGAGAADFRDLNLDEFDDGAIDADALASAPRKRMNRNRRSRAGRGGFTIPPLSIAVAALLVVMNSSLRILDVVVYDARGKLLAWQLTLAVIVLTVVAMRVRLGWQFARVVSGIAAVLLLFALVARALAGTADAAVFLSAVVPMVFHLGIIAALERPAAREWFELNCPKCGSQRGSAADMLFRRVRCKDCQAMW